MTKRKARGSPRSAAGGPARASCPNEPGGNRIIVFVKAPVPGKVKTRLCPSLTPEQAAALYRGFAADTVTLARGVVGSRQVEVSYDALGDSPNLRWLVSGPAPAYFLQEKGDLGARLIQAFARAFSTGARNVVVIGSDAPHLVPEQLSRAFDGLTRKDVILGPAVDGGYYLVGLRRAAPRLFQDVAWSSSEVLTTSLKRADEQGLSVGQLDLSFDVDTAKDLALLRMTIDRLPPERLVHTRRILDELSVAL